MEFFGLTKYGFADPIKDFMRPDYKEPEKQVNLMEATQQDSLGSRKKGFAESITELDCYIGYADGFAYKSQDRLVHMRRKYIYKPVGPCEMYKYPGVNSMYYGWWNGDPELVPLIKSNWHKSRTAYPRIDSEMSKLLNYCLKLDKYYRM